MPTSKRNTSDSKFEQDVLDAVAHKSMRKQSAKETVSRNPWFGLGFFGLIGWSIVIPTLAGIWIGLALDKQYSSSASWTLTLMLGGLLLGCVNAAYWVRTENARRSNLNVDDKADE